MAKKAKKVVKSKAKSAKSKKKSKQSGLKKPLTLFDRLPKDRGEWLEIVISLTDAAIRPYSKDCVMKAQKERLEAELAAWRASK